MSSPDPTHVDGPRVKPITGFLVGQIELQGGLPPEEPENVGTGVFHDGRELTWAEVDAVEAQFAADARHRAVLDDEELES